MSKIEEQAAEAVREQEELEAKRAQRDRVKQQKRQARDARKQARERRKLERKAIRFVRKTFGASATVLSYQSMGGHFMGLPDRDMEYISNYDYPVLEITGLPYLMVFFTDGYTHGSTGLVPICPDCGYFIRLQHELNAFYIYNQLGLGQFLAAPKVEHEHSESPAAEEAAS